jgi:hypothetical protein
VADYNGAFIFYTDDGGNQTAQSVNTTSDMLGLGDDDLIYPGNDAIRKAYAPSSRQVKDRGVHVLSVATMESTCILNLTNGSSAVALDLSTKHVYATSLDGTGAILRFALPATTEALLYADPLLVEPSQRLNAATSNATFVNTSSQPYGLALDLRFNARAVYWTQPGTILDDVSDGKIMKAYLDEVDANGAATRVIDLTPTINAALEDVTYGGTSQLRVKGGVMSPRGVALDLRKPHLRIYWLDMGVNTTRHNNSDSPLRDGRLFRSNLDGTDPRVILPFGYLKAPTSLVLDLVNNSAFVGDEAGRIWSIDMDYTTNENQNVSRIYNAPKIVFEGIMSLGALCPTCTTGVRMKTPTALALDYREREAYQDASPAVGQVVTTVHMYWTDARAGVLARGSYSVDLSSGLGTWGNAQV